MQRGAFGGDNRYRWSREDNKELVYCWMMSSPDRRGFRKRLYDVYHQRNPGSEATEQLLAGQVRAVIKRKVFSDVELEEVRRGLVANAGATQLSNEGESPLTNMSTSVHESDVPEDLAEPSLRPSLNDSHGDAEISDDDRPIFVKLKEYYSVLSKQAIGDRLVLPSLRSVKRNKLMHVVGRINNLCQYISTPDLRGTSDLMYAAAKVVTESLGISTQHPRASPGSGLPSWQQRLQNKLTSLRCDLSRLVALQSGHLKAPAVIDQLYSIYLVNGDPLPVIIETLRQKITALSRKISCFIARSQGFYQNRMFSNDQRRFYSSLTSVAEVNDKRLFPKT